MHRRLSFVLPAMLLWAAAAQAASLSVWRQGVVDARTLAESDPSQAHRKILALEAAIPRDATGVDRAALFNTMSRAELYLAMTEPSTRHAELALDIAKQNDDKVGQVEADLNLAPNAVNLGRIDQLVNVTTHAMTLIDGIDRPELLAEVMLRTGTMYGRIGDFDPSITMPLQALDIAKRSKNPMALAYAHQGMAIALAQTNRSAEILDHYEEMRENARAASSRILAAVATHGIGNALTAQGKLREGEALIREALAAYRSLKGLFFVAHALNTLSSNLKLQGRTAEAAALFGEAFDIYEKRHNITGLWWMLMSRSTDRQATGQLAGAAADAQRAKAIAEELGTRFYQSRSARRLAAVFAAQGDFTRAYALSKQAGELSDMADKERAGTRLTDLAQRYRTEARQREIDELKVRNEHQAAEQRALWVGLGASVVVLSVTAFFLLRLRRQRRLLEAANEHLHESRQEIEALNVGLEQRVQARTAELRQQARYLRTLIDMLPMWAWFKDTQSRYLVSNQAHARACGMSADEIAGKSDFDLAPEALARAQQADDAEVMASRERKTTEEFLPDGGSSRWMEIYKAPVADEDGTLLGTVGVARDVSGRKAVEEAREAALAEAERLAKLRSDFLAQMSHELRTPLHGILGYAELLRDDAGLNERQASGLTVIQRCGEQLLTLVNDVLDLAKIEAGKLEIHPSRVPLTTFLRGIADVVGVRAEQKGLLFTCEMAPDVPEAIDIDERLLRQVLLNLLANAIKFTDSGCVSLRVSREPNGRLRFSVEDTGIGIASDHQKGIFTPFEQTGETRRRTEGTGLGLAISRQFVARLGGEIRISSEPGKGSVFWFELEISAAAPARDAAPGSAILGHEGPQKLLAADADAQNDDLVPPPFEHMKTLHHLALQGNMRDIQQHADVLLQLDTRYHPFARRLRQLAGAYQSRVILELVTKHLEGNRAA